MSIVECSVCSSCLLYFEYARVGCSLCCVVLMLYVVLRVFQYVVPHCFVCVMLAVQSSLCVVMHVCLCCVVLCCVEFLLFGCYCYYITVILFL